MRSAFLVLAALAAVINAIPQGATSPSSPPPSDCSPNYPGSFEVAATSVPMKLKKRQGSLVLTLNNGVLKDSEGRTGYIASNNQLQFDNPPQANAIYTAGFSLCSNGSLALEGTALWWECQSGDFYNLYNSDIAAQCTPALIDLVGATTVASVTTTQVASESSGSQPVASSLSTTAASQSNATTTTATVSEESQNKTSATSSTATASMKSTVTKATASSPTLTGVAMSLRAGDAIVALAGFAAVALL